MLAGMTDPPRKQPARTPRAEAERQARERRLAAALRGNLRKRKEQQRARDEAPPKSGR
jgi:hypothetical protein